MRTNLHGLLVYVSFWTRLLSSILLESLLPLPMANLPKSFLILALQFPLTRPFPPFFPLPLLIPIPEALQALLISACSPLHFFRHHYHCHPLDSMPSWFSYEPVLSQYQMLMKRVGPKLSIKHYPSRQRLGPTQLCPKLSN